MSKIVTFSVTARKPFAALNAPAFIADLLPYADDEQVKPSHIKMNKATAAASMGGKASPQSFITGLAFHVAAYAYGQGKLEALQAGLPAFSQAALVAACQPLKFGAGITAGALRHAVIVGLEKLLSLPASQPKAPAIVKPEASTASQPEASTASQPEASTASQPEAPYNGNTAVMRQEAEHAALWAKYGDEMAGAWKASREAEQAPDFVEMFGRLAESQPEQAREMLESMAARLGLVVRKAPTKKAA